MRLTYKINDKEYAPCKNTGWKTFDKLGQLEDIEGELSIDLITLLKALKDGVYYKLNLGQAEKVGDVSLNYCASTGYFIHFEYLNYDICLDTKDYGKTWALTKEELEEKI